MLMTDELQGVLAEMDAQGAAERAVEGQASPEEARLAVQGALEMAGPPEDFASFVEQTAMRSILGGPKLTSTSTRTQEDGPSPGYVRDPQGSSPETRLFEKTAQLWLTWLQGDCLRASEILPPLRKEAHQGGPLASGAVHRRVLLIWLDAVEKLLLEDREAARRLWRRALDVGSSFGTESHPTILWAYIATFFPTEEPPSYTEGCRRSRPAFTSEG